MPVATGLALLLGGLAAAGGSVAASKIQSGAAKDAATTSSNEADKALEFQKQQYADQQANQAPYLSAGKTALEQLSSLTGPNGLPGYGKTFTPGTFNGGPAFQAPGDFKAPTGADFTNDPGFQFRLDEGMKALQRSGAAKGNPTGGAALKAAERYGQDYASNEYGNVYQRALSKYTTDFSTALGAYQTNFGNNLNTFNTNENNSRDAFNTNYNVFSQDQGNQFNRLAAIAGLGQTATGQLNSSGTATAANVDQIYSNLGTNLANLQTQGGNATASGVVGTTNAINGTVNAYQNYELLQKVLAQQNQSGYGKT